MIIPGGIKKINFISLIFLIIIPLIADFHPDIKWKEIKNNNFILIYPETYIESAVLVLNEAESIYTKLSNLLNIKIKKKVRIMISDCSDTFSSRSTIFPFCQIKINLAEPGPDRIYGSFKSPFNFFLSKEISKIFLSNIKGGPMNSLRKIFGNHPFLSPMLLTPSPLLEGYSTFFALLLNKEKEPNELQFTLKSIAESRVFPELSRLSGNYSEWPTIHSRLVFGVGFMLFLVENYPITTLIDLIKSYAKHPVKYKSSEVRIEHFLSKSLNILWDNFHSKYNKTKKNKFKKINLKVVDNSGMVQRYPVFIKDNSILYLKDNFIESLQLIINKEINQSYILNNEDISGISFDKKNNKLYYSASINSTPYYNYSEIFEYDLTISKNIQLSFGERLFDPVKTSKKDIILCIKRKNNRDYLANFNIKSKKISILSNSFISLSHPVISPDNKYIASAIKNHNSYWRIGLFDIDGTFIKYLTNADKRSYYPNWKTSNELFYISEFNRRHILNSYQLEENKYSIYDKIDIDFLKYFSFSDNKDKIVFTYLTNNGYNTSFTNFSNLKSREVDYFQYTNSNNENKFQSVNIKHFKNEQRNYKFFRDLIPKYYSFTYYNAGNEIQPGIYTTGSDLLKRHEYDFNLYYGFTKKKFSYDIKYKFNGFYQNIKFTTFDKYNLNQDQSGNEFILRTIGTQLYLSHPLLKTKNHKISLALDLHFEKICENSLKFSTKEAIIENDLINNSYNGFGLSLLYHSSKKHYDSISNDDGFNLSITFSKDLKLFGSRQNSNTLFFEYKHFVSIFRPNVLTFRLSMIKSWGRHERGIFMGGAKTSTTIDPLKNSFFGLMRGFPSGYFYGTAGYLLNTEYRISLLKIENTVLFLPYLERIYLTLFTDIGKLVIKDELKRPSISYGAEFNIRFNLGSPITIALGLAKGSNPIHNTMFYLRLENSF